MGIRYPDRELAPDPGIDSDALQRGARGCAGGGAASARTRRRRRRSPPPWPTRTSASSSPRACRARRRTRSSGLRARWFAELPALLAREETRRVAGGNQRLAEALAAGPAASCRAGHDGPHGPGGRGRLGPARSASSSTPTASELAADACVVAVPVLGGGGIAFDPPLPAAAGARRASPSAPPRSSPSRCREPPPPRAVMSVPGRWWTWSTTAGDAAGAWAGSRPVVEAVGDAAGVVRARRRAAPRAGARPGRRRPHRLGAGLLRPAHGRRGAARDTGSPHLVLAGEHTAGAWTGTMEGALRSGLRAARDRLATASRGA